ncbi:MAG: hypothetical protein J6J24_04440 [Clostridia bacterium]|nr:hypothetical protein [Clostridia bacterium]
MNFFSKVWQKLKTPKLWQLVLFYVFFAILIAGTIVLVVLQQKQTIWHFILYILSAISLSYFVYSMIYISPTIKRKTLEFMQRHKFTNSLLQDFGFRTIVFSTISFVLNLAYVAFVATLAIMTRSAWYIAITFYYLALILMKGNVFYSKRKHNTERKQSRAFRFCGIMFIFLTIALSGIITLIYTTEMRFEYAGILIYAVAAYTFYRLILSIINIIKAKKHDNLYVQSIRHINLASSLVSVVVLQVAMFQAFSPENNTSFANALTGAVVSLIILTLGIIMIVQANKNLSTMEIKNEEQE